MNDTAVRRYFEDPRVVAFYAAAVKGTGLWASEQKIFRRVFHPSQNLLELGCGAGRIAIGLHEMGFHDIVATDLCPRMVREFRRVALQAVERRCSVGVGLNAIAFRFQCDRGRSQNVAVVIDQGNCRHALFFHFRQRTDGAHRH